MRRTRGLVRLKVFSPLFFPSFCARRTESRAAPSRRAAMRSPQKRPGRPRRSKAQKKRRVSSPPRHGWPEKDFLNLSLCFHSTSPPPPPPRSTHSPHALNSKKNNRMTLSSGEKQLKRAAATAARAETSVKKGGRRPLLRFLSYLFPPFFPFLLTLLYPSKSREEILISLTFDR